VLVSAARRSRHSPDPIALAQQLSCPLTLITGPPGSGNHELLIEGLSRAAGDFVIEWEADLSALGPDIISRLLAATDAGEELVEVLPTKRTLGSRWFFALANSLRPGSREMRTVLGRITSRRVLSDVLESSLAAFGTYPLVLFAQQHLPRSEFAIDVRRPRSAGFSERVGQAIDVLVIGTRVSSRLPAILAVVFAAVSLIAVVYALVIFFIRGNTPEGWTTLLAFLGIATAGIFTVLAFLSGQLRLLGRTRGHTPAQTTEVFSGSMRLTRFGGTLTLGCNASEEGSPDGSSLEVGAGVPPGGGKADPPVGQSDRGGGPVAGHLAWHDGELGEGESGGPGKGRHSWTAEGGGA
jgi:hypothetical protein